MGFYVRFDSQGRPESLSVAGDDERVVLPDPLPTGEWGVEWLAERRCTDTANAADLKNWVMRDPEHPPEPVDDLPDQHDEPVEVPQELSFAQLLIGLVREGWISEAEGDAWSDGTLPRLVIAVISTLPEQDRFAARVRAKRPSVVLRSDPLLAALAAVGGRTSEDLDNFFRVYSAI